MAAAGNELAQGNPLLFPASLPHVHHRRGGRQRPQAAVLLERERRGRPVGARRGDPHRDAAAVRRGRHRPTATRPSPARASPPRWWPPPPPGCAPPSPATAPTRSPQVLRGSARDLDRQGLGLRHRLRAARPAQGAQRPRPGDRPARAQRRHGVDQRQGHRPRRLRRSGAAAAPRKLRALVDKYEDPADVYRIVFPPRARVRVTLTPRFGNPDLAAFTRSAVVDRRRRAADRPLAPQRASARTR